MAVKAVWFDLGETLVDESRAWAEQARRMGFHPHVVWAALGVAIERGWHHRRAYELLEADVASLPPMTFVSSDLYSDAVPCLTELRNGGYLVGIAGNQPAGLEQWLVGEALPVDLIGSSARWGVEKPARDFFERLIAETGCEPQEVAYVGDRVDNDVMPAAAAGLVAVHIRRGPWGYLQTGSERASLRIDSLADLPAALAGV